MRSRLRSPYRQRLLSAWASDILAAIFMAALVVALWLLLATVTP
jgi:hypothetical protein